MTEGVDLVYREMQAGDLHYVLSSWLRSYAERTRESQDYKSYEDFFRDYEPVVRALVRRSRVIVACLREAPDGIVGWYAIEGPTLHYVLVKQRWRRLGIARAMLADFAELPLVFTHRTGSALKCPIPEGWTYRRFRIWPAEEKAA